MTSSIGPFQFLALHGNPEPLKEEVLVLSRPGIDGVAVWRVGKRGQKLTLRSVVDALDLADARAGYNDYKDLIGQDPVDLVWCELGMNAEGFQVIVLDVRPVKISAILGGVGGLNPPSLGWLECDWDVIAVAIET